MSSKVLKATEGVVSTLTDLTLFLIFYQLELMASGAKTIGGVQRASEKGMDDLAQINYRSIKRALIQLKRKGFVKTLKDSFMEAEITSAGKRRIGEFVPRYYTKRPWDGNIYLVSYDIPVKKNSERNLLRYFLQKLGCGLLQESIWVTPYNPTKIIREFVEDHNLEGTILVSILGKDGSIGGMTVEELIEGVYKLTELNERYREFLRECRQGMTKAQALFQYLSILADDPQLPFELLPDGWVGDEAYKVFSLASSAYKVFVGILKQKEAN